MSELAVFGGSDLPSSWAVASLDDVAALSPKSDTTGLDASDLVHFVPMAAVAEDFGGIDVSRLRAFDEVRKGYTSFAENDVLFAKITPCMENGKGALVPRLPHKYAFGSTEFHVIRSSTALLPKWIAHYLAQPDFRKVARRNMTGTAGQMRVPSSWLATIGVPLAPISEQTRIVEKLEELLSDLDAGVAELKAAQRKLAQYRQSLLKAAVEGALTADWRAARAQTGESQETGAELLQRILTARRASWEASQLTRFAEQGKTPPKDWQDKYKEPVEPDTTDLPELPGGWVWASAEQICDFITKGTTPPKGMDADAEKVIPFLRVTNLTNNGSLDFTDRVFVSEGTHQGFLARSVVFPGDVLINIVGPPLGQVSIVPADFEQWNINQAIAIFRPLLGISTFYLLTALLSNTIQQWLKKRAKTTAGQTNLTLELCRGLPLPLPPVGEQVALTIQLDRLFEDLTQRDAALNLALKQASAQRKNILKAAFAGQLVPQDPNDEPATVLLERILAERVSSAAKRSDKTGRKPREKA